MRMRAFLSIVFNAKVTMTIYELRLVLKVLPFLSIIIFIHLLHTFPPNDSALI